MTEKKLIISADDFGISQKANNNILKLIKLNKLDRVSIITKGILSQAEISELLTSGIKLDIHLNLEKLSSRSTERKLKEGTLGRIFSFLFLYFTGKVGAATTEVAWENEIAKFEMLFGRKPDGINSHQHVHFFPAYLKVVLNLCKKNNINYLRFGKCCLRKNLNLVCFIINTLRLKNLRIFSQAEIITSDLLISLDWIKNIEKFSHNLPPKITELVCHPEKEVEFNIIKKYF